MRIIFNVLRSRENDAHGIEKLLLKNSSKLNKFLHSEVNQIIQHTNLKLFFWLQPMAPWTAGLWHGVIPNPRMKNMGCYAQCCPEASPLPALDRWEI